jgi:hypothetical protein
MNIEGLLEFHYGRRFLGEYAIVFLLQVFPYLTATTAVALFYKLFSIAGVGTRIESRSRYPHQVRSEIRWSLAACAVIALCFYIAFAYTPIEAIINYSPFLIFAFLTPVSLVVLLGIHVYLIFGIANGHSNYSLLRISRWPLLFLELTTFHQKHHSDGGGNFGYLYTHWDWVFGTRH